MFADSSSPSIQRQRVPSVVTAARNTQQYLPQNIPKGNNWQPLGMLSACQRVLDITKNYRIFCAMSAKRLGSRKLSFPSGLGNRRVLCPSTKTGSDGLIWSNSMTSVRQWASHSPSLCSGLRRSIASTGDQHALPSAYSLRSFPATPKRIEGFGDGRFNPISAR